MIPVAGCSGRSPGRIFIRSHPCLSTSIRVRWRPSTVPRQRFSGSNAGDHPTRMDTDKQRSGIADDGIKCRTLTNFPAYLSVLGVKKSNAEEERRGRRGRQVCRARSPGRFFIRVHPCLSTSIRVRRQPFTVPRHGSSDRNARDHSTWINNGRSPDQNSRRTSAYLGALGVKNNRTQRTQRKNAEDAEEGGCAAR